MTTWKLVPVEPTPEMITAAKNDHEGESYLPVSLYKSMLAAAPQPDVQPAIYPEEAREMGLEEVPYYTHPPAADVAELVEALQYVIRGVPDTWDGVVKAKEVLAKWEWK